MLKKGTEYERWLKRLQAYFIGFSRRVFKWSPAYRAALKTAYIETDDDATEWYRCNICKSRVPRKDKRVDHIDPVVAVGTTGAADWNVYRDRMLLTATDSSGLQVLCKSCHAAKTKTENAERRRTKKETKECPPKLKKRKSA